MSQTLDEKYKDAVWEMAERLREDYRISPEFDLFHCVDCGETLDDDWKPWEACEVCGRVYCAECGTEDLVNIRDLLDDEYLVCEDCGKEVVRHDEQVVKRGNYE